MRLFFGLLLAAFCLSACGPSAPVATSVSDTSQTVATPANAPSVDVAVSPADNSGLVARVNGVGISQLTFDAEMQKRLAGDAADDRVLAQQVLDGLIERELIRQIARREAVAVSPDDARAEIDQLKASLPSAADWESYLTMNNMTEPEMVTAMMEQMTTAHVRDALFTGLSGDVLQAHARHILVATETEASDLLTQLQNGADFETLARQFSIDNGTRENAGDLGWFTADELIDPRLAEVVFSLQPGAIAGPIPSRVGYHIVQLLETDERPIEAERMGVLMDAIYTRWLQAELSSSQIERYR